MLIKYQSVLQCYVIYITNIYKVIKETIRFWASIPTRVKNKNLFKLFKRVKVICVKRNNYASMHLRFLIWIRLKRLRPNWIENSKKFIESLNLYRKVTHSARETKSQDTKKETRQTNVKEVKNKIVLCEIYEIVITSNTRMLYFLIQLYSFVSIEIRIFKHFNI